MKKLNGQTADIISENISKLKQLFPDAFTEGKIDFAMLQRVLGEAIDSGPERYSFTWHGKSQAIKMALRQSTGTLRPKRADSKNWDSTQNLFIEGDNLEVLRALQDSYRGKVKMIYIDPPYNTGKDFIYEDNFDDNVKNYKEKIGLTNQANADTSGRYHTNWLNMMYPRLRLARNLLKEDGVIFISIDDNEVTNLRKICDEIFGEENFIAQIVWLNKEGGGGSDSKNFKVKHEYIICYAKNIETDPIMAVETEEDSSYSNEDEFVKERGKYKLIKLNSFSIQYSKSLDYPIIAPDGSTVLPSENGRRGCWRWSNKKLAWGIENKFIIFHKNQDNTWNVYTKQYFKVDNENSPIVRSLPPVATIEKYSSTMATKQMELIFGATKIFDYSKPYLLIQNILSFCTSDNDLILDFFAGSGTTAHAVMQLNAEDGGNRKFIMVQIPEPTPEDSEARKAGYTNIVEIAKERIHRAGEKIKQELIEKKTAQSELLDPEKKAMNPDEFDIGFKVFALDETNFTQWDPNTKDIEGSLAAQLTPLKVERKDEDAVYEVLLKYGVDLASPIEEITLAGKKVFSLAGNYLLICLEDKIGLDTVKEMAQLSPHRAVFYDHGFLDDTVKANAEQTLKKAGVEEIMVI